MFDSEIEQLTRASHGYMDVPNCARRARTGKVEQRSSCVGPLLNKPMPGAKETRESQFEASSHREIFRRRLDTMTTVQGSEMVPTLFIGRWTPKILFSLKQRPYRHGQLRRYLGRISQRMLTRTLRNLESTGLIARRVTGSKAVAVEYSLTQLGGTIIAPLRGMCHWAKRYRRQVTADVRLSQAYRAQ